MTFTQLAQLLVEADTELGEETAANVTLEEARAVLVTEQAEAAAAQEAVDAASTAAGGETADVVAKLRAIKTRCDELIAERQV